MATLLFLQTIGPLLGGLAFTSCATPVEFCAIRTVRDTVRSLYTELGEIAKAHEELTDTEVREALHETLNYAFVWGKPLPQLPVSYGMFSAEGDAEIAAAVARFLEAALPAAEVTELTVGERRLAALQDETITTPAGEQFDLFIGHTEHPLPPDPCLPIGFSKATTMRNRTAG